MKVSELIAELSKMGQDKEVFIVGEAEEGDLYRNKIVSKNPTGAVREYDNEVYVSRLINL